MSIILVLQVGPIQPGSHPKQVPLCIWQTWSLQVAGHRSLQLFPYTPGLWQPKKHVRLSYFCGCFSSKIPILIVAITFFLLFYMRSTQLQSWYVYWGTNFVNIDHYIWNGFKLQKMEIFLLYLHLEMQKILFDLIFFYCMAQILSWQVFSTLDNNFAKFGINIQKFISFRVDQFTESFIEESNVSSRCETGCGEIQGR